MASFNTTLQLDEPADVVQERINESVSPSTYGDDRTAVNSQPGSIVVIRRYRPAWAIFLIRSTQTLTISISPRGEGGCTVVASGEAEDWVISNIQAALADLASSDSTS